MAMSASQIHLKDALSRAVDNFKVGLDEAQIEDFRLTTVVELKESIKVIQNEQASERKLKDLTRLSRFLEHMERYARVIDVFSSSNMFLPFIWGPVKFLLQVAKNHAEAFNKLLDTYQNIGETIPLIDRYTEIFKANPYMVEAIARIYKDILEFHQKAVKLFVGKGWQKFVRSTWKAFNSDFDRLLENLRSHKALIESQASLIEFERAQQYRTEVAQEFRERHDSEMLRRRKEVEKWLSAHKAKEDQEKLEDKRMSNTGAWILDLNQVKAWIEDRQNITPYLWIKGIPGAGKSILASKIVETLRQTRDVDVIFFYFKWKDPHRDNFLALARSLCDQVLEILLHAREERLYHYLFELACNSGESYLLKTEKLAKEVLETALSCIKNLYVVVDGLDECKADEQKKILNFFTELRQKYLDDGDDPVHCLFVSQDDVKIRKYLKDKDISTVKIERQDSQRDINLFVRAKCEQIEQACSLDANESSRLQEYICARADGMFMYAELVMLYLRKQTQRSKLRYLAAVDALPNDLNEAYARIVENLFEEETMQEIGDISPLLEWITCATRPLKWHEIQCGVSADFDNGTVDFEENRFRIEANELCGSLIEVSGNGTVELVHTTAKKYLLDKKIVNVEKTQRELAERVLRYLCLPGFDNDIDPDKDSMDVVEIDETIKKLVSSGYFAFMEYSVGNWFVHIEEIRSRMVDDRSSLEPLFPFLEDFLTIYRREDDDIVDDYPQVPKEWEAHNAWDTLPRLLLAINATKAQLRSKGDGASANRVLTIPEAVHRIRGLVENSKCSREDLKRVYGPNIFKCPRMNCIFFYEGFETAQLRDEHVKKHEAPFVCTYEDCPLALFGFVSDGLLRKHLIQEHDLDPLKDDQFPMKTSAKPQLLSNSTPVLSGEKARVVCRDCGKSFARYRILFEHKNAEHKGAKPFHCGDCGADFARKNDLQRHRWIHSQEPKFQCQGSFFDAEDEQWVSYGCGRVFARKDALNAHHKTVKGQRCIAAFVDNEERERVKKSAANAKSLPYRM